MDNSQSALPLTIISGYLGSGKTTLVNHLLRNANGRRLMVLVNDFGDLPIDADLIQSRDGDMINLANGCACCSMGGDLFNALVDVLDQSPGPDHLLIEASGIADPARIANIALAEPDLKLDATVSLVDAETLEQLISDPLIGETIAHQLNASDIIILNKLDLVDPARRAKLHAELEMTAPAASIIETEYSKVPMDLMIGLNVAAEVKKEELLEAGNHAATYSKWSKNFPQRLDRIKFKAALDKLDKNILRLKGIVWFEEDESPHIIQHVGSRHTITQYEPQNAKRDMSNQSRLIAIGLKGRLDIDLLDDIFTNLEASF